MSDEFTIEEAEREAQIMNSCTVPFLESVIRGQDESRRLNHNYVGSEQILIGILAYGNGIAFKVLNEAGLTLNDVRKDVEELIGRGNGYSGREVPLTPRARRILVMARTASNEYGHKYIGTEHLLLALLKEKKGLASKIFEKRKISVEHLRYRIMEEIDDDTFSQYRYDNADGKNPYRDLHTFPHEDDLRFRSLWSRALSRGEYLPLRFPWMKGYPLFFAPYPRLSLEKPIIPTKEDEDYLLWEEDLTDRLFYQFVFEIHEKFAWLAITEKERDILVEKFLQDWKPIPDPRFNDAFFEAIKTQGDSFIDKIITKRDYGILFDIAQKFMRSAYYLQYKKNFFYRDEEANFTITEKRPYYPKDFDKIRRYNSTLKDFFRHCPYYYEFRELYPASTNTGNFSMAYYRFERAYLGRYLEKFDALINKSSFADSNYIRSELKPIPALNFKHYTTGGRSGQGSYIIPWT